MSVFVETHKSMINVFSFVNKIPNWLRWILVIPVIFIADAIYFLLLKLIAFIFLRDTIIEDIDYFVESINIGEFIIIIISCLISPIIMVMVSTVFAPNKKVMTGLVIATGLFILSGMSIVINLIPTPINLYNVVQDLIRIIGTFVSLFYIIYGVKPYEECDSELKDY